MAFVLPYSKMLPYASGGEDPDLSAIQELTTFVNNVANGYLPSTSNAWFDGTSVLGTLEENSYKHRPIAIGMILRPFIGRQLVRGVNSSSCLFSYFLPYQVAVGIRNGTEAIIGAPATAHRS